MPALTAALEGRLLDLRHVVRGPVAPPSEFAIVAIDDKSSGPPDAVSSAAQRDCRQHRSFDEPGRQGGRGRFAAAGAGNVKRVDALSPGDAVLAAAIARNGHVILASTQATDAVPNEDLVNRNIFASVRSYGAQEPRPAQPVGFRFPIVEFVAAASLGHANLLPDPDGALRRIALAAPIGTTGYLPAMPLKVVSELRNIPRSEVELTLGETIRLGHSFILLSPADNAITLNHYGAQGTFPTYSMIDVIDGKVPDDQLRRARCVYRTHRDRISRCRPVAIRDAIAGRRSSGDGRGEYCGRPLSPAEPVDLGDRHRRCRAAVDPRLLCSQSAFAGGRRRARASGCGWRPWPACSSRFSSAYLWLDATTYILVLHRHRILHLRRAHRAAAAHLRPAAARARQPCALPVAAAGRVPGRAAEPELRPARAAGGGDVRRRRLLHPPGRAPGPDRDRRLPARPAWPDRALGARQPRRHRAVHGRRRHDHLRPAGAQARRRRPRPRRLPAAARRSSTTGTSICRPPARTRCICASGCISGR